MEEEIRNRAVTFVADVNRPDVLPLETLYLPQEPRSKSIKSFKGEKNWSLSSSAGNDAELRSSKTRKRQRSQTLDKSDRLPVYGPLNVKSPYDYIQESKFKFQTQFTNPDCPYSADTSDFDMLKVLGTGAFGKVLLVRDKRDTSLLAMKAMAKKHLVKMKQINHALNEKKILQLLDFPFTVRMEFFAKDNSYIYLFMPFVRGGEMFEHIKKVGKFTENQAKFFAAQVILALEYLHTLKLVYRDLKTENLLLDHTGYLKVTDMGFTKPISSRTYTFCGTPHYIAPEVIVGHGYGFSVDWWSLGVLLYELNSGSMPFDADDHMTIFKKILNNNYIIPTTFSKSLRNLIPKLLETDVTHRFGNLRNGAEDIKRHPWLNTIMWDELFNRRVPSPYVPLARGSDVPVVMSSGDKRALLPTADENEYDNEFKNF